MSDQAPPVPNQPAEYAMGPQFVDHIREQVRNHPNVTELSFDTRVERQALIRFRNGGKLQEESFVAICKHFGWAIVARRINVVPIQGRTA